MKWNDLLTSPHRLWHFTSVQDIVFHPKNFAYKHASVDCQPWNWRRHSTKWTHYWAVCGDTEIPLLNTPFGYFILQLTWSKQVKSPRARMWATNRTLKVSCDKDAEQLAWGNALYGIKFWRWWYSIVGSLRMICYFLSCVPTLLCIRLMHWRYLYRELD